MIDHRLIEKLWREATIRNNFVFSKTMELYPDLCRRLLELILNVKIKAISYPEREKTIETRLDGKGIRLDVYVEDKTCNRMFDVEMQISDVGNLAKRIRYYQGLLDMDKLKRGQHYSALGESFIIFICPFDRFKQGRHIYTFKECCIQDPTLELNDGTTKVFLSTKGTADDISPDVKAFLDYVDKGIVSGKFIAELDDAIDSIKFNKKVGHDFMTFQMYVLEREKIVGDRNRREGRLEGQEAIALKMIRRGRPLTEIHEDTDLPLERIKQLADKA